MKRCKPLQSQRIPHDGPVVPFVEDRVIDALDAFNRSMDYVGIDDPLGEDCLYEKLWINYYLKGETWPIPVLA